MTAFRIMVGPVNHAAPAVPFVLAMELHAIPFLQRIDARRQVDVVRNQQGLAGTEPEQETLMPRTVVVVGQDFLDRSPAANLQIALLVFVSMRKNVVDARFEGGRRLGRRRRRVGQYAADRELVRRSGDQQGKQKFFHAASWMPEHHRLSIIASNIIAPGIIREDQSMHPDTWIEDVIRFWFEEIEPQDWFVRNPQVDARIRARFHDLYTAIRGAPSRPALTSGRQALATVIVLDQFPRNMFRGLAQAFATDATALAIARQAIAAQLDSQLTPQQRVFLYMPFQHAEDPGVQASSVELFSALGGESLAYARQHKEVIDRFGRFPHRNAALGRESTPQEIEFMKTHPGF